MQGGRAPRGRVRWAGRCMEQVFLQRSRVQLALCLGEDSGSSSLRIDRIRWGEGLAKISYQVGKCGGSQGRVSGSIDPMFNEHSH